jgi:hypothetical protein
MVVGLELQQVGHAIAEVVIEVATGAELFVDGIEELAAEALVSDLGDDEFGAQLVPVERRAGCRLLVPGVEQQFDFNFRRWTVTLPLPLGLGQSLLLI